jgi:hypothetical protein
MRVQHCTDECLTENRELQESLFQKGAGGIVVDLAAWAGEPDPCHSKFQTADLTWTKK